MRDLEDLATIFEGVPIVMVGASALALQLEPEWRRTFDLDLTIALSIKDYPGPIADSIRWTPAASPIGWRSDLGTNIDLIPVGPEDLRNGSVVLPGGNFEMSLTGFRHAFDRRLSVPEVPNQAVGIAPVPVVALLKMVSYQDRPDREKDLEDLAYIFERYPAMDDERRFEPRVYESAITSEAVGAFVLGAELADWTDDRERKSVEKMLEFLLEESDGGRARALMLRHAPRTWGSNEEELLLRVRALKRGLEA